LQNGYLSPTFIEIATPDFQGGVMLSIDVQDLFKVFGPARHRSEAVDMARRGKNHEDIQERTGCTVAVREATFTVEGPEIFVIMGLSGSGKSTLLRCVNRLMEPTAGEVRLDGEDILAMDREQVLEFRKKRTAMVFQHFGLLSHRTVLENAAFGLEIQGVDQAEREAKGREVLELVGLEGQEDSMVNELSGGMQQRVGLARALATEADILIMDEAFSALDPLIRTNMQAELLELQEKMPKLILFITHDLGEALTLGDRIAIMKDGAIVQIGGPEEIVIHPADDYVASFVENVDRSRVVTVGTAMRKTEETLSLDDPLQQAVERMESQGVEAMCVGAESGVQGVLLLEDAVEGKQPIVVTGWKPHWMFARWDLKFLKDPKTVYGEAENIHTVARPAITRDLPKVADFFQRFFFTDQQIATLMDQVNKAGDPAAGARKWRENHQELVESWLPAE
jgi:glycine betaine/proline transport system ATP-binding protein